MKRPEKIIQWMHVDRKKSEFVNHLGKPKYDYSIEIPSWIGLAYNPWYAKVEIHNKPPAPIVRYKDGNPKEIKSYFKSNWSEKVSKMRKLNHGYMQIFTLARCDPETRKLSLEEYNQYHQELRELNKKYGVGTSTESDSERTETK